MHLLSASVMSTPVLLQNSSDLKANANIQAVPEVVNIEVLYKIIDERNIWSLHDQNYLPSWSLTGKSNFAALNQELYVNNITSKNEIAMFLAQSIYQTNGFSSINAWNYPNQKYFIRGYFRELKTEDQYTQASLALFNDDRLVKDPSLALDEKTSWKIAVWFWQNVVKAFPGVTNQDGSLNFGAITRSINENVCTGPSPRTAETESGWPIVGGGALSYKLYDIAYRALQVQEPKSSDCGCMVGEYKVSQNVIFPNTMAQAYESTLIC